MLTQLDRAAKVWAEQIARAYAAASRIPLKPEHEEQLARDLQAPMAECIGLATSPTDWPANFINPGIARWEARTRWPRGPRVVRVKHGDGTAMMGP